MGRGRQYQAPPQGGRHHTLLCEENLGLNGDENPPETEPHAALLHLPLDSDILAPSALGCKSPPCTGPAASGLEPHLQG